MLQLADAGIAWAAQKAADFVRYFVVVNMKPPCSGAGVGCSADGAFAILGGEHRGVSAMSQTKSNLELDVCFPIWVPAIPLAIVSAMLLGIVAVARDYGLLLARLTPILRSIPSTLMWVEVRERFGFSTVFAKLHGLTSCCMRWFSTGGLLNQLEA